ncbi:hypothetical protein LEP1GSC103_0787 [Leptospira borgpetersenii serovar Javanica str. UI 09931]|uniref:Uncharacterized protein n=3 Tax=Leptospira borgpetersenii TaxID=174 RepID=M3HHZ3_LEPBO|nr:hypothetical protein LEP1GSC128_1122 [Leptospira borgpetersenii str. 200801926]EKQ91487.1 hypothetical protein LEP1GSC101_1050 [Leptospira borgpetersenii str. UI 09149]EKR01001.1 hypothetical protein LEP1GSC121_1596 [Leptospira borgpetersenii serovar Castellonis str. 200801910]EMF97730.1 hypothetical protein LEP1GSC123_1193 [Leptospira borgpetersenii str. 200701203]EMK13622.1 hypothetical protein LEP1GSC066_1937 [Leptospira sp. serovar Kenya str. Sh9]EMN58678.1 hypothetical protein LEP1GSC0
MSIKIKFIKIEMFDKPILSVIFVFFDTGKGEVCYVEGCNGMFSFP